MTIAYDKLIDLDRLSTFKDKCDLLYAKDADLTELEETVAGIVAEGGEPNTIDTVKVNGTALTPDANKAVDVKVEESTNNGKIKVNGSDVAVHGLGTAAYTATTAYDANGAAAAVLGSSTDAATAKTVYGAIALANTKTDNAGTVTNVSGTSPISVSSQSTTPVISISAASGSAAGSMSSAHYTKLEGIAANATANAATTTTPKMDGTAAVGSETAYAKGDHVHPTDTSRAPLASPTFTGTPAAPTANTGTNTTQIATTAFVQTEIANAVGNAFQSVVTSNSTISDASYKKGMFWVVGTAGTYVGQICEAGDTIYAVADKGSSYSTSDFTVVQTNIDVTLLVKHADITLATTAEVEALFSAA